MEHYREAEQCIGEARQVAMAEGGPDHYAIHSMLAAAQVHATLALAAVQAMSSDWRDDTSQEWQRTFDRPSRVAASEECSCCNGDPDTVCDACGEHSCWAGVMYCEDAKTAGTRQKPSGGAS